MRTETRKSFNDYKQNIASLNGIESVAEKFVIAPTIQQKLEERIQQSSEFLKRINIVGVDEQKGEKLGMDAANTIAGRTNTANADRVPSDISALDANGYECVQTNFDTAIKYAKLDAWAKFPNFQTMLRDVIVKRQALDRIMIGFNGTSAAADTDRTANPLLQDVNKGWVKHIRENAAERVMSEVVAASNKIKVGAAAGKDYENLDALVFDAANNLIHITYQEDPRLVVICGKGLMADKYFPIINQNQRPEDQLVMDMLISQKRIGGLPGVQVPFFPANAFMITPLENLSLYWQIGARRRTILDNAKRDQIENYESSNEAYVVEDYRAACYVENIALSW
ncbi:Major capsid protein [Ferriphaselus amnicola]|uniref:Major capsid protein n=2 Tax=Ferriphaselus amnicola TaxID=1188319 RepID=A0A2Z6GCA2_9PROT|nr:Major capsid protein [Ferriphaselus amnicola]